MRERVPQDPVEGSQRVLPDGFNVGMASLEIDVARDKIVMALGELTGNIWSFETLDVVIQRKLVWVRPQPNGIRFVLAFVSDVRLDQIFGKHLAL